MGADRAGAGDGYLGEWGAGAWGEGREASTRTRARAQGACGGHPPAHLGDPGGSAVTRGIAAGPTGHGNSLGRRRYGPCFGCLDEG